MKGKFFAGLIVAVALCAGLAMYWLQVYAYYVPANFEKGAEISLTPSKWRSAKPGFGQRNRRD